MAKRRTKSKTGSTRRRKKVGVTFTDDQKLELLQMKDLDADVRRKILKS